MDVFVILDPALGAEHLQASLQRLAETDLVEILDASLLRRGIVSVRADNDKLEAVRSLPFVAGVTIPGTQRAITV